MGQTYGMPPHKRPGERPTPSGPTYLVHAHPGINPIGQVSTRGFASRVHAEPSCPGVSVGGTRGHLPTPGLREAAGAPGNSPWDPVTSRGRRGRRQPQAGAGGPRAQRCRRVPVC